MANTGIYGTITVAIILIAAVVLLFLYQTRIRIGNRDPMALAMCALALATAAVAAWILFPGGTTRYTCVCVAVVILARTGYLWSKNPKTAHR